MLSRSLSRPLLRLRSFVPSVLSSPSTSSQPDQNEHAPPPLLHRASFPGGAVRSSFFREHSRSFSSSGKGAGDGGGSWKFTQDGADDAHDLFGKPDEGDAAVAGLSGLGEHTGDGVVECRDQWRPEVHETKNADIFQHIDQEINSNKGSGSKDEWETVQGYKPWGFEEDEGKEEAFQFDVEQGGLEALGDSGELENVKVEQLEQMDKEEQELLTKLKVREPCRPMRF